MDVLPLEEEAADLFWGIIEGNLCDIDLKEALERVILQEREACARIAEKAAFYYIAQAIRQRGGRVEDQDKNS
jgi:hypothetical protein